MKEDENIFATLDAAVKARPGYDPNAKLDAATLSEPFRALTDKELQELGIEVAKKE
jgi:hypothetical protein